MPSYDQRLKELLRELFAWFFALIVPDWVGRFDLARVEWSQQETFLDPPTGQRRILDMVARLSRTSPAEDGSTEVVVNVEIESDDRATVARRQFADNYRILRQRHQCPVLPLALYLNVALEGRGIDSYTEKVEDLDVYTLKFPYLGLSGLDAATYVEGENLLGVALSVLMRTTGSRAMLKATAMNRFATAELSAYRRHLLVECVDAYCQLEGEEQQEYERLLLTPQFTEASMLAKTTFEKGMEKGIEKRDEKLVPLARAGLLAWLQTRFPDVLSTDVRAMIDEQKNAEELLRWSTELSQVTTAEEAREIFLPKPESD